MKVRVQQDQLLAIDEFMHPRLEEICETLPAGVGRWLMKPHFVHRLVRRCTRSGRVVATSSLRGHLLLWAVSRMRAWRRRTLRYALETQRIEDWLAQVLQAARHNPALALEVAQCQRLVKGYGDTHERGWASFRRLMAVLPRLPDSHDAVQRLRDLQRAALADDSGSELERLLSSA